jgi:hypothetical protein
MVTIQERILKVIAESILDRVADWHDGDVDSTKEFIWEHLGWTREEYIKWAFDPNQLPACELNRFKLIKNTPS